MIVLINPSDLNTNHGLNNLSLSLLFMTRSEENKYLEKYLKGKGESFR